MKFHFWAAGLTLLSALSFLFSPAPEGRTPGELSGEYVRLNPVMGFVSATDAYEFCNTSRHPRRLLARGTFRQNRPLHVLMATALGHPLQWLARHVSLPKKHRLIPFYTAYVLLNFLFLFLSLLLLKRLLEQAGPGRAAGAALIGGVFLVSNEVVKAFVWTAHSQMFAILSPLVALAIMSALSGEMSRLRFLLLGLTTGLLPLAYGNFLLLLPCGLAALFLKAHAEGRFRDLLPRALVWTGLSLLPVFTWMAFVIHTAGAFTNEETTKYHQFLWLKEAFDRGLPALVREIAVKTPVYLKTVVKADWVFLALSCGLFLANRKLGNVLTEPEKQLRRLTGTALALFFLFFWGMGYYPTRLAFTLAPLLIVICALEAGALLRNPRVNAAAVRWGLRFTAAGWAVYWIFSYGPFR